MKTCPKAVSGKHNFEKERLKEYPVCTYCGLVNDTYVMTEKEKMEYERAMADMKSFMDWDLKQQLTKYAPQ